MCRLIIIHLINVLYLIVMFFKQFSEKFRIGPPFLPAQPCPRQHYSMSTMVMLPLTLLRWIARTDTVVNAILHGRTSSQQRNKQAFFVSRTTSRRCYNVNLHELYLVRGGCGSAYAPLTCVVVGHGAS